VLEVIEEAPDVRTFRLDNAAAQIPLDFPGKFAKVCVAIDDREVWRSFTISSSPTESRFLDLTIKRNPAGEVSNWLFENVAAGGAITLKAPQGGFYFDPERHREPLVLISVGSGITPMISIARYLQATGGEFPCTFLYGARTPADILYHDECLALVDTLPGFRYHVTLSQPGPNWSGPAGRLDAIHVRSVVPDPAASRYFLCGPNEFMDDLSAALREAGVPSERIHTEQFQKGGR
jgi:ferredoxin-NADP reductase